jgi:hypothetical protein
MDGFCMLAILQMSETMNSPKNLPFICLAASFLAVLPLRADEIKLKSGQTLTGRITYEAADIVKMEIPISASIKETKIIGRADIDTIVKDSPDDVEFNKIQTLVPTGSMVGVDSYRKMLETGPEAFLKNFPGSQHTPKVKEIRATLAEELDKVERGFMKLEGEWLSPQDKVAYKELIESKIRLLRMESSAKGNNYSQLIAAMREFEVIEENYFGSPAFPKAVELAKQVMPVLGRQLQSMASSVDYQNAEYEKALAASTPEARVQLTAARAREDQTYSDSIAADKKAGVKWVHFNPRNKQGIEEALRLAATELPRIQGFDTVALTKQAELLVEADKLIAADKISEAKTKITEASVIDGQSASINTSKSKPTSKSNPTSKGKGNAKSGSYLATLNGKINARITEEQGKAKAKAAASESEALTANLRKAEEGEAAEGAGKPTDEGGESGEKSKDGEMKEGEAKPDAPVVDEFAALGASTKGTSKKKEEKEKQTSKKSKSKKAPADDGEGDEDDGDVVKKPRPAPVVEEEGLPFWIIPGGITLLAVIGIAVMKVLGLGGKKDED